MSWSVGTGTIYNEGRRCEEEYPALINNRDRYLIYVGKHPHNPDEALFVYKSPFIDKMPIYATKVFDKDGRGAWWRISFPAVFDQPSPWRPKPPTDIEIGEMKRDVEAALLAFPLWPTDFSPATLSRFQITSVQFTQ